MQKHFPSILLTAIFIFVCAIAFAESQEADLDLAVLSGNLLTDRITEIRSDPAAYAGKTVRIRGQYYASSADAEVQRSLIVVCTTSSCVEVGLRLAPAEDTELAWPDINREIEVHGTLETYETAFGTLGIQVAVHTLLPL